MKLPRFTEPHSTMIQKVAVITGGSSGIGRALALEFGLCGYYIVFTGKTQQRIDETSLLLATHKINHVPLLLDVAKPTDDHEMIEQALAHYGRIDVLICNAGITQRRFFQHLDLKDFEKVMKVNFYGAVYSVHYALPHLIASKGTIIAISSINGYKATPGRSAYSSSKFAMQGFFDALRMELKSNGVHVLVVNPGFTATNIRNAARNGSGWHGASHGGENGMMTAKEVAKRVYQAATNKERDLILTALGKIAVSMNKFFPGFIDSQTVKIMARADSAYEQQ